jgi:hypothetical protein
MGTTYNRICIKNYTIIEGDKKLELKRGQEYLTSPLREESNEVRVFSTYWAWVPAEIFAGEKLFTP